MIEGERSPAPELIAYISLSSIERYGKQMWGILILSKYRRCLVTLESRPPYRVIGDHLRYSTTHPTKQQSRTISTRVSVASVRWYEIALLCASARLLATRTQGLDPDYETEMRRDAT